MSRGQGQKNDCISRENRRSFLNKLGGIGVIGTVGTQSLIGFSEAQESERFEGLPPEYHPKNNHIKVLSPAEGMQSQVNEANIKLVALILQESRKPALLVYAEAIEPVTYSIKPQPESLEYRIENVQHPSKSLDFRDENNNTNIEGSEGRIGEEGVKENDTTYYDRFTVGMLTRDPVDYRLCRTEHWIEWAYDNNYASTYITDRDYESKAWAPTGAGTHWYHDFTEFRDRSSSSSECYSECFGKYYNDDFNDPNLRTYATHEIGITGFSNGTTDYYGVGDAWGDSSALLDHNVGVV